MFLCASLVALVLSACPASAAEAPSHPPFFNPDTQVTGDETPAGHFEDACGVAVEHGGNIFVADYYHHVIDLVEPVEPPKPFSPSSTWKFPLVSQLVHEDPLDGPCGLALSSAGDLYVNNFHRNVVRFAATEFPGGPGSVIDSAHSTGVAVDPASGNVFVNDRTYIAEYEVSGALVTKIGIGLLREGYGVAVSDFPASAGNIYVPDAAANNVKVFDSDGTLIDVIDGAGTPRGGFVSLFDASVIVDQSNGHLYVVDNSQPGFEQPIAVVDEFNAQGAYRGQLPAQVIDAEPSGLAVNDGNVYVTSGNSELASVLAFGPTIPAKLLTVVGIGAGAGSIRSAPAGVSCGGACAAEFNTDTVVTLIADPAAGSSFAGWSGGGCSGTGICRITLSTAVEVSAEFTPLPPEALLLQASHTSRPTTTPAQSPAATLEVGKPAVKSTVATIAVTVPAAGTLSATGRGLGRVTVHLATPGPTVLHLHLNATGRQALRRAKRHRLALALTVAFVPSAFGVSATAMRILRFKTMSQGRDRKIKRAAR